MKKLPFIPGQRYNRRLDIHAVYGGNRQSGIVPTKDAVFIFTGHTGTAHGYEDRWDNANVFSYTGAGQRGDMRISHGNKALVTHRHDGKRVFLFEQLGQGAVRFVCEVELFDYDYFVAPDTNGDSRLAIKFFFQRVGAQLTIPTPLAMVQDVQQLPAAMYMPQITEREGLITSRVGQGAYRKRILHRWHYRCAVTSFDQMEVLIASHIVPWADANDRERLDVHNGILLSPTYDALFDRHLISFDHCGHIILHEQIAPEAFMKIGVTGKERIHAFSSDNLPYLERHQKLVVG